MKVTVINKEECIGIFDLETNGDSTLVFSKNEAVKQFLQEFLTLGVCGYVVNKKTGKEWVESVPGEEKFLENLKFYLEENYKYVLNVES